MNIDDVLRAHGIGVGKKLKGDATVGQVRSGATFSNALGNANVGTLVVQSTTPVSVTPTTADVVKGAGIYDSTITVVGDPDLVSANIKAGTVIFGISGAVNVIDTTDVVNPHAVGDILAGHIGFVNGAKQTGTMVDKTGAALVITPGTADQAISVGYYPGAAGDGKVLGDTDLIAGNIKNAVNIFGVVGNYDYELTNPIAVGTVLATKVGFVNGAKVTGTMPNIGATTLTPASTAVTIPAGYHNGSGTVATDADLVAGNIRTGINIFGVVGNIVESTGGATTAQVLSGVTFSIAGSANLTGVMPNIGAVTVTPGISDQTISAGYHNGSGKTIGDADLVSANIKSGINIFGVAGNANVVDTNEATTPILVGDVMLNHVGFVNGAKIIGTMPDRGATTLTPISTNVAIPAGYHNGSGIVSAVVVPVANVKTGTTIAGQAGTMPNNGAVAMTPNTTSQVIAAGYHSGGGSVAGDIDLVAGNIKNAVNIFGVVGNYDYELTNPIAVDTVLSGKVGFVNGVKVIGTIPSQTGGNMSWAVNGNAPAFYIPDGYYSAKNGWIYDVNLDSANILSGTSIFGVAGSIPNNPAENLGTLGATLKNLITNGSFNDGLAGWTVINSTTSITGGVLSTTATASGGQVSQIIKNIVAGHILYGCIKAQTYIASGTFLNFVTQTSVGGTVLDHAPVITSLSSLAPYSIRFTAEATTTQILACFPDWNTSGWGLKKLDDMILIDLTACFGAGNEPTQAQMDALIAAGIWFDSFGYLTKIAQGAYLTNGIKGTPEILLNDAFKLPAITVGETVIHAENNQVNTTSASYITVRTVNIKKAGAYRSIYTLSISGGTGWIRLMLNGTPITGSNMSFGTTGIVTTRFDYTFAANDIVSLQIYNAGGATTYNGYFGMAISWPELEFIGTKAVSI